MNNSDVEVTRSSACNLTAPTSSSERQTCSTSSAQPLSTASNNHSDSVSNEPGFLQGLTRKLRQFVGKRVQEADVVDDIVQETFARTYQRQAQDNNALASPEAYMTTVARHVIYEHWKRIEANSHTESLDDESLTEPHSPANGAATQHPSPEKHYEQKQQLERMLTVLEGMPPLRQKVFTMRRLEGKSRQEIASELEISPESVKKHITRAMLNIADALHTSGEKE